MTVLGPRGLRKGDRVEASFREGLVCGRGRVVSFERRADGRFDVQIELDHIPSAQDGKNMHMWFDEKGIRKLDALDRLAEQV